MRSPTLLLILSLLFPLPAAGIRIPPCGGELTPETSLWIEFGLEPDSLPWLSDEESAVLVNEEPNRMRSNRFAVARSMLWDPLLRYRTVEGVRGTEIPVSRGRWRFGRVTHPISEILYDIVHWADTEELSATLFFRRGTSVLCQLSYESRNGERHPLGYSRRTSFLPLPR
ncbi:MAG: hypothetical protein CME06_00730 [Gemmatimonadetes bacterium]|nr:hypothetical protein [Gemmatimonadota bacterium]